jgi:hypothetical protein
MNHTTLVLLGVVLVAATLVISALAVAPALAGSHEKMVKYDKKDKYDKKGDSSATVTNQANKQKGVLSGFVTFDEQDADNCIAVLNDANACRQQGTGGGGDGGNNVPPEECASAVPNTRFDITVGTPIPGAPPGVEKGDEICIVNLGTHDAVDITAEPDITFRLHTDNGQCANPQQGVDEKVTSLGSKPPGSIEIGSTVCAEGR